MQILLLRFTFRLSASVSLVICKENFPKKHVSSTMEQKHSIAMHLVGFILTELNCIIYCIEPFT